ncbi:unnamed protein product [Parnassius apollo]|uniref:(apollo) hypothetical protein n=1 Tax=Parnassius apollo TaxID=110799 RepID=A0A8S3WJF6_PARAO|nr:unnamed protein product [Parnassius apollo]
MSDAQCLPRRPCTSPCNYDELNLLITLARALEENEYSKSTCKNGVDIEEIIIKLINALVYTTVSNGGSCYKNNDKNGGMGGYGYSGNKYNSGEGLINLDLLNQNDPNNILDLDLGNQNLLGIGLGTTN